MVSLTVAIPVFNGEENLEDCLNVILTQTFEDFIVKVYDNNSTDRTADIVSDIAKTDKRVHYFRNLENIGAGPNFLNSLVAADTEFFVWRADDDLCSQNYFQVLIDLLVKSPGAVLAVGHTESQRLAGITKQYPYVGVNGESKLFDILRKMFISTPAWIYGIWRTEQLQNYYLSSWKNYPFLWANDHLVILNAIINKAIIGDNSATFIQRFGVRGRGAISNSEKPTDEERFEKLFPMFLDHCMTILKQNELSPLERNILGWLMPIYARKRVLGSKMLKLRHR